MGLLAQAKSGGATMLRALGEHPDDKAPVEICSGRYGSYAHHGKIDATLPKDILPDEITLEQALELICRQGGQGRGRKGSRVKNRRQQGQSTCEAQGGEENRDQGQDDGEGQACREKVATADGIKGGDETAAARKISSVRRYFFMRTILPCAIP